MTNRYERWLWQKVDYAIRENLTHFIDDDPVIERLFVTYAAEIAFLRYSDSISWQQTNDFVSGNPN